MDATPEGDLPLFRWPSLGLLLSSLAVGIAYLLYLFDLAPALVGVFPRRAVTFLLGQLSVSLFAAYLVVVFVTRSPATAGQAIPADPRPAAPTGRRSMAQSGRSSTDEAADDDTGPGDRREAGDTAVSGADADGDDDSGGPTPRQAAMTQFTQALDEHLGVLCAWYVAAHPEPAIEPPASYEALFAADFGEVVRRVDFATPHPAGPPDGTWLAWSAIRLREFRRETMAIIDVYSASVEPTVVAALHNLANSRLTKRVLTAEEAALPAHLPADTALVLFRAGDTNDPLQAHIDLVEELIATHETHSTATLTPIDERDCWQGERPEPGVARAPPDSDAEHYYKLF